MDGISHPGLEAQRIEALLVHARWIEDLAHRLVRDHASAEDLAQATWAKALRTRALPRSNVRGWLARVLRNLARESHRRESARARVEQSGARAEALPSSAELVLRADAERKLVETVLALEEPHRQVLLLRYFEGLSAAEIAEREQASLSTVSNRLTRAHDALRERLVRTSPGSWVAAVAPIFGVFDGRQAATSGSAGTAVSTKAIVMSTSAKLIVSAAGIAAVWLWISNRGEHLALTDASETLVAQTAAPQEAPLALTSRTATSDRVAASGAPAFASTPTESGAPNTNIAPAAPLAPPPGRIHGRVYRPDGELAAARKVRLFRTPRGPQVFVTSDEHGRFDGRDLAPGKWAVSSIPDDAERKALGLAPDPAHAEFLSQRTVELESGADVEIELGAPPKNPIRVSGRLVGGATDAVLHWVPEGEDGLDRAKYVHSREGAYEIVLESPGRYLVSAILDGPVRVEHDVDVPDEREFVHDVETPSGAIHGRVRTGEGAPLAKVAVALTPRAGLKPLLFQASFAFQRTTGSDGRFEFGLLRPGVYAVSVSGGSIGEKEHAAAAVVTDIVVAVGSATDEIDIVLAAGSVVRGRVRPHGSESVVYTNVFVLDERGEPLNPLGAAASDNDGAFELPALRAGRYTLIGARGILWTDPVPLEVVASGETPEVELTLRPAATLEVDGANVADAWIDVRDAGGNCLSALLDRNLFNGSVTRACLVGRWRYLVPEGNYEVRVRSGADTRSSARVATTSGAVHAVTLER